MLRTMTASNERIENIVDVLSTESTPRKIRKTRGKMTQKISIMVSHAIYIFITNYNVSIQNKNDTSTNHAKTS